MSDYERKLAVKEANADARKAVTKWRKLGTMGIDSILKSMGYSQTRDSMYKFSRRYWAGMSGFTIVLDVYDLVLGKGMKISAEVRG